MTQPRTDCARQRLQHVVAEVARDYQLEDAEVAYLLIEELYGWTFCHPARAPGDARDPVAAPTPASAPESAGFHSFFMLHS